MQTNREWSFDQKINKNKTGSGVVHLWITFGVKKKWRSKGELLALLVQKCPPASC